PPPPGNSSSSSHVQNLASMSSSLAPRLILEPCPAGSPAWSPSRLLDGKGNANAVPSPGALPECGRNLLRTASFCQIHDGKYEPILSYRALHRHDISCKRTAFRGINTRVRRSGTLSANKGRECRATATVSSSQYVK